MPPFSDDASVILEMKENKKQDVDSPQCLSVCTIVCFPCREQRVNFLSPFYLWGNPTGSHSLILKEYTGFCNFPVDVLDQFPAVMQ